MLDSTNGIKNGSRLHVRRLAPNGIDASDWPMICGRTTNCLMAKKKKTGKTKKNKGGERKHEKGKQNMKKTGGADNKERRVDKIPYDAAVCVMHKYIRGTYEAHQHARTAW